MFKTVVIYSSFLRPEIMVVIIMISQLEKLHNTLVTSTSLNCFTGAPMMFLKGNFAKSTTNQNPQPLIPLRTRTWLKSWTRESLTVNKGNRSVWSWGSHPSKNFKRRWWPTNGVTIFLSNFNFNIIYLIISAHDHDL